MFHTIHTIMSVSIILKGIQWANWLTHPFSHSTDFPTLSHSHLPISIVHPPKNCTTFTTAVF